MAEFRAGRPDLLLLDLLLPDDDGVEVCRRLRAAGEQRADPHADRPATPWRTASPAWRPAPTTTWSSPSRTAELVARVRALLRRARDLAAAATRAASPT